MNTIYTRDSAIQSATQTGYALTRFKNGVVIARQVHPNGMAYAKAWRADNSAKPAFNFRFRNVEQRDKYCAEFYQQELTRINGLAKRKAEKQALRDKLKASDHYQVGDCLNTHWGYDQTNVEFYQVIEVKPRSIVIREIMQRSSDCGGPYGGKCAPRRFEFSPNAKPISCRLNERGGCCVDGKSFLSLSKWTGSAIYCSSYA